MRRHDRFKGAFRAADWRAWRLVGGHPIPLRGPTVTMMQQPRETSRVDGVNFIQGYAGVYSTLNSS
jgi:hypothetical protein